MSRLHCEESIRDAFISELQSSLIRQRLLEKKTLDLKTVFDQARSLESAMKSSESYAVPNTLVNAAVPARSAKPIDGLEANTLAAAVTETTSLSCYFCGNTHVRSVLRRMLRVLNARKRVTTPKYAKVKLPQRYQLPCTVLLKVLGLYRNQQRQSTLENCKLKLCLTAAVLRVSYTKTLSEGLV